MFGVYYLPTANTSEIKSHNTPFEVVTQSTNLDMFYDNFMAIINGKLDEFAERDSGNFNEFLILKLFDFIAQIFLCHFFSNLKLTTALFLFQGGFCNKFFTLKLM